MIGIIIKVISNFAYVELSDKKLYQCTIKGSFRYNNIQPLVGDKVEIEIKHGTEGIILKIFERKNELIRPPIVNIDQVIIITSTKNPNFSSKLLNKYLFIIEYLKITPILVFTKRDLLNEISDKELISQIKSYEKMGYIFFWINNKVLDEKQLLAIQEKLKNKISVFVGQTGAGKSTTINRFLGYEHQKIGEISKALKRGKHTTRISEIFEVNDAKLIDTPGFSAFELQEINDINWLSQSILPFANHWQNCKFVNCIHYNEPKCEIKKLVNDKKIPKFFYEDYVWVIEEIKKDQRDVNKSR